MDLHLQGMEQPDVNVMKAFIISRIFGMEDSFVLEGERRQFGIATLTKVLLLLFLRPSLDD